MCANQIKSNGNSLRIYGGLTMECLALNKRINKNREINKTQLPIQAAKEFQLSSCLETLLFIGYHTWQAVAILKQT